MNQSLSRGNKTVFDQNSPEMFVAPGKMFYKEA